MFHRVKSETDNEPAEAVTKPVSEVQTQGEKKQDTVKPIEVSNNNTEAKDKADTTDTQTEKENAPMSPSETAQEDKTETQVDIPSSPYQRAGTAPASAGGYPGATTAAAQPAYPGYAGASNIASSGDRRLTIGAGITMSGEIEACDYLLVEGTVEAALKGASVLDIAETGVFYGTVEIEDATIAGRFEGDITAQGRLVLREGATVTGTIAYKELEIEAGAIIDGKLTPLSGVSASANPAPSATKKDTKVATKTQKAAEKKPEAANNDGGLFSKAATAAE
ncbi:MAG: polymer-forming cytoskeletal protein [Bdellovibrionales bacterium]